jgi:hypothetical protein
MPAQVTGGNAGEVYLAQLADTTNMSPQEWEDFLTLDAGAQLLAVQEYADAEWATDPDSFGKVLAILGVIGTIAGVISGVGGAVGAIQALKSL